jgi:hypothetical protein
MTIHCQTDSDHELKFVGGLGNEISNLVLMKEEDLPVHFWNVLKS